MKSGNLVGSTEITFNLNMGFYYNSLVKVHSFAIRKRNWISLLKNKVEISNHEDFVGKFKRKLLMDFMNKIYFPIKDFEEDQ